MNDRSLGPFRPALASVVPFRNCGESSNSNMINKSDLDTQQITVCYSRPQFEDLFDRLDVFDRKIMTMLNENNSVQADKLNKISEDVLTIKDQINTFHHVANDLTAEQAKLKKSYEKMKIYRDTTDRKIKALQVDVEELRATLIASINKKSGTGNSFTFEDVITELQDRFERKNNVVINGIPESPLPTHDLRQKSDTIEVMKAIKFAAPECTKPLAVFRMGHYCPPKIRLIKVCFATPEAARLLLRNKDKASAVISTIRIYGDVTPLQLQRLRNLNQELDHRVKEGENDLTIKFQNGIPKIIEKCSKLYASR